MSNRAEAADLDLVPLGRSGFDASTRDPAMKAAIAADPVHADVAGVPARVLAEVATITAAVHDELERVSLPLLVMHGTADTMAAPQASIDLYERAASTDKTLHLVHDGYHALLRDLDRDQTLETVIDWMDGRRVGGPAAS